MSQYTGNELAHYIAMARGIFVARDKQTTEELDQSIRVLNAWGLLSTSAMAEVAGVSTYHVEKIVGTSESRPRGKLNPTHLPMLGYMVSSGKVNPMWLTDMLLEGTSLSTISDLTGISEATLYRSR